VKVNERIKGLRQKYGMPQEELAEKCSVSRSTVQRWEKGLTVPDITQATSIAKTFGVSASFLIGEPDDPSPLLKTIFGQTLEIRRKALNMSRSDLAERLGVGTNTVFRWEKGQRSVDDEKKKEIAKILQCTVSYLMGEIDDPSPQGSGKKAPEGVLRYLRDQTGLSLDEVAALINLPAEDLDLMEKDENRANDTLKQKLIKTYGRYLSDRDGETQRETERKKGQSEEDLETLIKMLAAEDPDIVLKFHHVAKNVTRLSAKDKAFLATLFKAVLGQIEIEDYMDESRGKT